MRLHAVGQMSCHHACHALAEFAASPLPIQIEIKHPARSDPIFLILATARARSRFLNALDILSGRLLRVIQFQKVRLPRHSQFATWSQQDAGLPVRTHYVASRINLVEHLREHPLPVTVTFLYGQNTSVAEQNWVHFNKFRHTMRAMATCDWMATYNWAPKRWQAMMPTLPGLACVSVCWQTCCFEFRPVVA